MRVRVAKLRNRRVEKRGKGGEKEKMRQRKMRQSYKWTQFLENWQPSQFKKSFPFLIP